MSARVATFALILTRARDRDMHVYYREPGGKRGKYYGFVGPEFVRSYWDAHKIGPGIPPHIGFFARLRYKK